MLRIIYLFIVMKFCDAFNDASYRSSVMHDERPILRMGPEEPQNEGGELKEPEWVTVLKTNIDERIKQVGYDKARPDIKQMIEEANLVVNSDLNRNLGEKYKVKLKLRSADYYKKTPEWETDLKKYIKELVKSYGRSNLEGYVKPVVEAIQESQNVVIKDIDVNPDGDVSVNYANNKINLRYPHSPGKVRPRPEPMYPGFTMGPNDDYYS